MLSKCDSISVDLCISNFGIVNCRLIMYIIPKACNIYGFVYIQGQLMNSDLMIKIVIMCSAVVSIEDQCTYPQWCVMVHH